MKCDVIINGGGPVGMGLAIELAQRGCDVTVIERYHKPQPIPKGQNLTQRTTEHFHFWGCEAALRSAHPIPEGGGIGGLTVYGTLLGDHAQNWLDRSKVGQFYHTRHARLPQYVTERVLRDRVAELPNIEVRYGFEGVALAQDQNGVTLEIARRGGTSTESLRARYLVGCDGSHSFVRKAAGITETREDHERQMALLVFESEELDRLLARYPGKAFYNVLNPENDGYWWFFGRVDHGRSWFFHAPVPTGTTAENYDFAALLHRAVGQRFDLRLDHVGFWDMRFSLADQYRKGRVFIAGDAAHSHPPYGGYGVNSGLEDAVNLGWKLAATGAGWGSEALLDSYQEERRAVFESTARDFIARFIEQDRAFLEQYDPVRNEAAFRDAWARRADMDEVVNFAPNYAGSSIVSGSGGQPGARGDHCFKARAGHHLAPAPVNGAGHLYDALGPWFTLFIFDGDVGARAHRFRTAAAALALPLVIRHLPDPALAERYGAAAVLVRPDQFVAWAGSDGVAAEILGAAIAVQDSVLRERMSDS
ncbi:FAD-dependent monooxygenase [Roseinatronobacter alkalisoli]|uniref:FAD-dependent monooxygenase n=1 Tax=Roseinatronobacter alkalisoli TaxID=3028235 RepID=A0ABT5T7I4_9RHOB|nr:FAD-dependent monooxygenase [Roseinatronobacter sp. HJB301]MDD7970926.1 FAD-dependent monooxygenase [Roseinatronobacter sp. HJB301]